MLSDPKRLNAISYKVWLDNNAVGYVAFNRQADSGTYPEYRLVASLRPGYLTEVSSDSRWTLYRVEHPTPIVRRAAAHDRRDPGGADDLLTLRLHLRRAGAVLEVPAGDTAARHRPARP